MKISNKSVTTKCPAKGLSVKSKNKSGWFWDQSPIKTFNDANDIRKSLGF